MNISFRGENLQVTQALKNYTNKKMERVERHFGQVIDNVYVKFKVYKVGQKVEVTIPITGMSLRAEETCDDLYAAIDLVVDKLERQIRKHKTKINRKARQKAPLIYDLPFLPGDEDEEKEELTITRKKTLSLKPMSEEEAILQMDLLDHEFYVFIDMGTNQPSIVYTRKDGSYGLIATN